MKLEHFENVKDVDEERRNFQNLMVAKGLTNHKNEEGGGFRSVAKFMKERKEKLWMISLT